MSWYDEPTESRLEPRKPLPDGADQAAAIEAVARFIVDFEEKTGQPLKCPACGATTLFPVSFEMPHEYDTTTDQISRHPRVNVAPAAVVACARCPSLLKFSWLWIRTHYGRE